MSTPLDDVIDRAEKAVVTLTDMSHETGSRSEALRLRGKVEGVRLVLSYLEEEIRVNRPSWSDRQRLELAKKVLVDTGYFTEDQVGDDIAPRITELFSFLTSRIAEMENDPWGLVLVLDRAR